ncbi:acetyl-CoA carboxylase biotin carboxyl carrier protein [Parvularcula oceani]|uniref:acetyl-CoA carboxylase biotin carboxyl carrier protein n=1 Tax=Parvularcula oceani TaxID=1247963 RepID=UPI0004E18F67|nr:acetyl-CoA carboxylase biotin carboxyl carrier protein [Parvularcula oceani]
MAESDKIERDLDAIRALAEVLDETGLSEVEIERGSLRLRVSRGVSTVSAQAPAAGHAPAQPAQQAPAPETPGPVSNDHPGAVRSPMVGTAYLSPSPGAAPFVTVGATVSQGQTVMIVEAMKTMNEIKAPSAGTVKEILARDAEPVEFDEVLLIVE